VNKKGTLLAELIQKEGERSPPADGGGSPRGSSFSTRKVGQLLEKKADNRMHAGRVGTSRSENSMHESWLTHEGRKNRGTRNDEEGNRFLNAAKGKRSDPNIGRHYTLESSRFEKGEEKGSHWGETIH